MVLAACQASQVALEMQAADEGSAMTFNFLRTLADPAADANQDRHLSLGEIYRRIRNPVVEYIRKTTVPSRFRCSSTTPTTP